MPTRFGRGMLEHWTLDPSVTYLNHGTVGATPRRVLEEQQRIRDGIERQPARAMLREVAWTGEGPPPPEAPRLRVAARSVAEFVGARGEDLVFVDNATTGVNAVLRSLDFGPGDEILLTDHSYGAVVNAARYVARRAGATVRLANLPCPVRDPDEIVRAIESALGPQTRLAILDHVTSSSALVVPLERIVPRCRARGAAVLVDGAHAPGGIALDVPALGADWYAGNLHKWAWAPRSCGFLWASTERQRDLHPAVISWGLDRGFTCEFDWVGTRDPSPWLAAPVAIAWMRELGVEDVLAHNHALAWQAARTLAEAWDTPVEVGQAMVGSMATALLPARLGTTREDGDRLRDALLFEDRIEVPVLEQGGRLRVRVSAQVYNDQEDIRRLAEAVSARLERVARSS